MCENNLRHRRDFVFINLYLLLGGGGGGGGGSFGGGGGSFGGGGGSFGGGGGGGGGRGPQVKIFGISPDMDRDALKAAFAQYGKLNCFLLVDEN